MMLIVLLLLPLATGLACVLVRARNLLEWLNLAGFIGVAMAAARLGFEVLENGPVSALNGFLYADALSALVIGLATFVALVSSIYAIGYFRQDEQSGAATPRQVRRYYRLTPLFVFAMLLVALANNLGVMWVATEGTTLASVLLIAFYNQKSSLEAAWKYIIIGSVGISLALFGTVVVYYAAAHLFGTETSKGLNWSVLVNLAGGMNPSAMRLAWVLVLLGYGTKAGLAPMHTWKPDAYAEAPAPAAALLGAGVINCALYGIIRFYVLAAKCLGAGYAGRFLLWFGLGSMVVAVPFILVQRNFRRLLAYSSIEHAGIMVAALGFGGALGALGAMLHILFHAITKPLLFFCAGNIQQHFATPFLRRVRGAIHVLPVSGALFILGTLAATGTPPFSIFQSEFTILSAALNAGHNWLALLFVLCVVAIFAGFLHHAAQMNLGEPPQQAACARVCGWKLGAMALVAAAVITLGFWLPAPLYQLVSQAAAVIAN
jgi:hydrogenase-4 component F